MANASSICVDRPPVRLPPVSRRTIGDDVLDNLRKAILSGAFAPGVHLAEGALGLELGVSRAPVREAMVQLEREGLLVFDKRGAAHVKAFSREDFEEIFSLRLTLETMAARLTARRFSAADAAELEEIIRRTAEAESLLEVILLDVAFHDAIVRASGHRRLHACWSNLRHQIEVWLARMRHRTETPLRETREATVRTHEALLRALGSGSEETAVQALRAHIEGWRQQVSGT